VHRVDGLQGPDYHKELNDARELARNGPVPGVDNLLIIVSPCDLSLQRSAYPGSPEQGRHRLRPKPRCFGCYV